VNPKLEFILQILATLAVTGLAVAIIYLIGATK